MSCLALVLTIDPFPLSTMWTRPFNKVQTLSNGSLKGLIIRTTPHHRWLTKRRLIESVAKMESPYHGYWLYHHPWYLGFPQRFVPSLNILLNIHPVKLLLALAQGLSSSYAPFVVIRLHTCGNKLNNILSMCWEWFLVLRTRYVLLVHTPQYLRHWSKLISYVERGFDIML